ncbi:MAG: FtsX-like permease family protein, partial [Anaerolineaceae bacterium]|nr:FtsX-like permease family protein [Anaerolineaceae bacterium]
KGLLSLESRRTVLSPQMVEAARKAAKLCGYRTATTSVYLANSIMRLKAPPSVRPIPYSTMAGIDTAAGPPFGPLVSATRDKLPESLGDDEILLNIWASDNLGAGLGEQVEVTFYRVAKGGRLVTDARRFTVRGIVAMKGITANADLVPEFEGVTNAQSLRDWKPPFPLDLSRIRKEDEQYWKQYRATPKAFVSLETARQLWASEGQAAGPGADSWVTSVRVAPSVAGVGGELSSEKFAAAFMNLLSPREAGLAFRPVKDEALRAARGATDFASLFLGLSSFLVISAALLVGLLMRLSAENRAREAGLMLALGFAPRAVTRTLLLEGLLLALAAAVVGVPLGVAYACGIIAGLATLWSGLLGPFTLSLHVAAASLAIGAAAGIVVAMAAMWWSVRVLRRRNALLLLVGWRGLLTERLASRGRASTVVAVLSLALAAAVLVLALAADVIPPTAAFFLSGALLLVAGVAGAVALASSSSRPGSAPGAALSIWRLAFRYARRQRVRSVLTVGLLASASFAIVAVAANRNDLSLLDTSDRASGAGGFALLAESELPIHLDFNTAEGRRRAGLLDDAPFQGATILSLRLQRGDDASCLNLQRVQSPRVVGVPGELVARGGFSFADFEPLQGTRRKPSNPWELLDQELTDGSVPVIGDEASVKWILHSGLGRTVTVDGPEGKIRLRIVGLLRGSIWQSELLMSERHFIKCFGGEGGYRRFLIEAPAGRQAALAKALRSGLADQGFDVRRTADLLARYAGVQNAYLSAFHTLGGLALVLGTFGVVTVLLRNIVERRGELGLMLAVGFQRRQLVRLLVLETGLLVLVGLAIGAAAGLLAVAPHLVAARADVPWWRLAATMVLIVLVALAACIVATRRAVGAELLAAIRSE